MAYIRNPHSGSSPVGDVKRNCQADTSECERNSVFSIPVTECIQLRGFKIKQHWCLGSIEENKSDKLSHTLTSM